jgi:serine/threonine protein kinase
MDEYELLNSLGSGSTAEVVMAKQGSQYVALKMIRHDEKGVAIESLREIQALNLIKSRYVIKHINVKISNHATILVLPLAQMDLSQFILDYDYRWLPILYQISLGLKAIHDAHIIHGDLKPANILVFTDECKYVFKIADLGLAQFTHLPQKLNHVVVTLFYRPPELLLHQSYNQKVDLWSLGCILYELKYQQGPLFPAETESVQISNILNYMQQPEPDDLLSKLLTNQQARYTCNQLIKHLDSLKPFK